MRTLLAVVSVIAVVLAAPRAEACSCAARTEAQAFEAAVVVAVGVVELGEQPGRATFVVTKAEKGAEPGDRLEVRWVEPDGFSCYTVRLKAGEWRLFLAKSLEGEYSLGRCDQYSRPRGKKR